MQLCLKKCPFTWYELSHNLVVNLHEFEESLNEEISRKKINQMIFPLKTIIFSIAGFSPVNPFNNSRNLTSFSA